ncbi:P-loop NTPase fold protein [Mucilaginibacter sp. AW1-7]|uniref:P-loop NTPase fold protein n=1 Tax=Mucilaginibacter sp. AW1-7 TaxID=3349874 RepID=UPI003F73CFE1
METKRVIYRPASLFSTKADVLVIPCSTEGLVAPDFLMGLNEWGINLPEILPVEGIGAVFELNEVFFRKDVKPPRPIRILFACTTEDGQSNLAVIQNIAKGIAEQSRADDSIKEIAMPLMATGDAKLKPKQVVQTIDQVLQGESRSDCLFNIYIRDKHIFDQLVSEEDAQSTRHGNIKDQNIQNTPPSINFPYQHYRFFAVGSTWDGTDQYKRFLKENIWENGYADRYLNTVRDLRTTDLMVMKSSYSANKISYLRVKAIGWVTENFKDGRKVEVIWMARDLNIDIPKLGSYRGTIARMKAEHIRTMLEALQEKNIDLSFIAGGPLEEEDMTHPPSSIATLIGDTDTKTDYLGIHQDVMAFAKVIAARRFRPPLAIALFGKWGSGKSFFMQRLIEQINALTRIKADNLYCQGIVQIHFNAWSYLDANLWASIVSRIFEGLNDYISNDSRAKRFKDDIEKELSQKLVITYEEISAYETQLTSVQEKVDELQRERDQQKQTLENNIRKIQTDTLSKALKTVSDSFKVREKVEQALKENISAGETLDRLKNIVPEKYWNDPEEAYKQAKSTTAFVKEFFNKERLVLNLVFVAVALFLIFFFPAILTGFTRWLKTNDFSIPSLQVLASALVIISPALVRIKNLFQKMRPLISSLWEIKINYQQELDLVKSEHEQREKAIRLTIEQQRNEINGLDQLIQQANTTLNSLKFKIKHALATEALYSFIEKRCKSEDYRKMLGIVSIVRNDFETLSQLFAAHSEEAATKEFRKKFDRPLERIVLYIDDLDRCPEERVVEVLEAVNLLMAFELFVVVVGVDPRWVKNALIKKYQFQFTGRANGELSAGIETIDAADYLEKIFQVPFHLKPAGDDEVKQMLNALVAPSLAVEDETAVGEPFDTGQSTPTGVGQANASIRGTSFSAPKIARELARPFLELSKKEASLIESMSVVLGANPRAVKRFVNSYQIVRAHEGFIYFKEHQEREYAVCMFLLALPTGKFRSLQKPFIEFIYNKGNETRPLNQFLDTSFILKDGDLNYLKNQLDAVLSEKAVYHLLQNQLAAIFKHHYQFIQRFTFESGNEEHWLS